MNANEMDEVFAEMAGLPEPVQRAAIRSATLTLTLRTLAANGAPLIEGASAAGIGDGRSRGDRSDRSFVARWLSRERFVPAVLCLAGALYTRGAVQKLVSVFAPEPASFVRAARETEWRARYRRVVVGKPHRPTADGQDQSVAVVGVCAGGGTEPGAPAGG